MSDALAAMRVGKYEKAAEHFREAARKDEPEAFYMLGLMHQTGQGVTRNYRDAAILYRHIARKGHTRAQVKLADLIAHGRGMKANSRLAYMWYEIAARSGELSAFDKRNRLATNMKKEDIDIARKQALVCIESKFETCQ